jgi:hypothetical protein
MRAEMAVEESLPPRQKTLMGRCIAAPGSRSMSPGTEKGGAEWYVMAVHLSGSLLCGPCTSSEPMAVLL